MYPARYKISLRITHPNMDPEDISGQLGLSPFRKWKAGSQRTTPTGKQLPGTYKETYCVFDLDEKSDGELESTLCTLTKQFRSLKHFFKKVRSTGGSIEYFIGLFVEKNTGIELDGNLMAQLVNLGIDLSFDIYELQHFQKKTVRRTAR
jgi:hypothetical protein